MVVSTRKKTKENEKISSSNALWYIGLLMNIAPELQKRETRVKQQKIGQKGQEVEKAIDNAVIFEFGGSPGVAFMMFFFPCLMYYFWICLEFYEGKLQYPASFSDIQSFFHSMANLVYIHAYPTWQSTYIYVGFCIFQAILSSVMPGVWMKGLPVPSENNIQLDYLCNGVSSWYLTMFLAYYVHTNNIFNLTTIIDNFGPIMTVAIITGFVVTLATYFITVLFGKPHRMSHSFFYDLFMGVNLNPRIGILDLKMWSEIRVPWTILFFISLSASLKFYETHGVVSMPLVFMTVAHWLYVNACMKGEECIPTTWDIFYEKWGFMLIFWNFAGVPFTYCYGSLYLLKQGNVEYSNSYLIMCFSILFIAYYVWDTANSQKNRFRMQSRGTFISRYTFPQLPWGTLVNPTYIKTAQGNLLLTSGWWGIARKIHYTADLAMALSWGLITGFNSLIPYFYFAFFLVVLTHRVGRDMQRCALKYGDDWIEYTKQVPWIFIPYVY